MQTQPQVETIPPIPSKQFSPEINQYFTLNGWECLGENLGTKIQTQDILVFKKGNKSVVFIEDLIHYKEAPKGSENGKYLDIIFNWEDKKYYCGYDGHNIFQLMMLMDFMEIIRLKDIDRELRQSINIKNFEDNLELFYRGQPNNLKVVKAT